MYYCPVIIAVTVHDIIVVAVITEGFFSCVVVTFVLGVAPLGREGSAFLCSTHKHAPKWGRGDEWEGPGSLPGAALSPTYTRTCTRRVATQP